MKLWLILLGLVVMIIDFATYGFKYYPQDITIFGWIIYGVGAIMVILGLFMRRKK